MVWLHIFANVFFRLFELLQCRCFSPFTCHFIFSLLPLKKSEEDAYWQRQQRNKIQGENNTCCFLFPSFVNNKTEEDPECFHSVRYWVWFGGGGRREIVCLGLKKYTGKFSQWRLPWCQGRATYTVAGTQCFWGGSHPSWCLLPVLGTDVAGCAQWCGSSSLLHAEQGLVSRSWQRCWANLGESSSLVSRAQGSE